MLDFVRTALWPRIPTLRIASANRLSLDRLLLRQFERLDAGCVLDVGAKGSPYTRVIPATQYMRLDIDPASDPDICCDIHDLDWKAHSFDTVVAVEVLEHLYDPQLALDRVWHVLRPGGICIASTRFLYRYHPDPHEMINAGGRSRVLLNVLNPLVASFESQQTRFPLGFVIYARK